jgi:aspartate/methionine/tyrosine aminotransferase
MNSAKLANNPQRSRLSPIRETFKAVKDDASIANLCIGDPSFPPPPEALRAAEEALDAGQTHYENDAGNPVLRAVISEHESTLRGVEVDPYRNLVVTAGGTNGIYSISRAVLDPGDEVLLPEPIWIPFIQITRLLNCEPIMVPTTFEAGFIPSPESLEARLTERTKMLVVVSPGNPTGAVYDRDAMLELTRFCELHGIWLLHDEAYRDIVFGRQEQPSQVGHSQIAIGVRTVSKSHAMTGFRVGWVLSSNEDLIDRVRLNVAYNVMCASTPGQIAAIAALRDAPNYLHEVVHHYESRLLRTAATLRELGFEVHDPKGSFYLFPRHGYGRGLAERLLRDASVAVVDGEHFGPSGEGHIRISCAADDAVLESGLERIAKWIRDHR